MTQPGRKNFASLDPSSLSSAHPLLAALRRVCTPVLVATLLACAGAVPQGTEYRAQIRRTDGGIPHIRANDLGSLGFGTLYAMAEDNACILADQYLTFAAKRSLALGPESGNADRDFFYQLLIERGQGAEALPREIEDLFAGAAAGYNHYLRETGVDELPDAACAGVDWVREVTALDVKRVSRADYALAYMLPLVVAAAPPRASSATPPARPLDGLALARAVAAHMEVPKEGGSNAIAIGRDASQSGAGMLIANPHMPWDEPFQRFYPMHQTLPGRFDALGATLIGRPRVGFGTNANLAWTSTVSTAKRFALYRLELVPGDPTQYLYDGEAHAMQRETVTIQVRSPDGTIEERKRTFYSTHFGALLVESKHFGWDAAHAFAVRLTDSGWRGELSALEQLQATSVREMKAIHDRYQFLTVNLIAADRSGEVLYGDLGPVPNMPDARAADCALLHGAAVDGTRSECQWGSEASAAVPGIFGPEQLPFLYRTDFVTNSNDSHWLANPAAPLNGYPRIIGSENQARTLRTRSGLQMLLEQLEGAPGTEAKRFSLDDLQRLTLANENYAGQLIRDDLVAMCRTHPNVTLEDGTRVELAEACDSLAAWDLHANLESRGAHVFRQFLAEANGGAYTRWLPTALAPRVAFDPSAPVATPSGLDPSVAPLALRNLGEAVRSLAAAKIALDAPLGELQGVTRAGERIPLHGGPEYEGVFNKLESRFQGAAGYPEVTRSSSSWIMAVDFDAAGPRARGILTYSLSANPASPHFTDQTHLYSRKQWLELPFHEKDIEAAKRSDVTVHAPRSQ